MAGQDAARLGGRACLKRGSRRRTLLHGSGRQDAREVVEHRPFGEGADAKPQLGADRPACRPALVSVVDEHLRELGIGPRAEPADRGEARADEQRLSEFR